MQLTKKEDLILLSVLTKSHPDTVFVEWANDPEKDVLPIMEDLVKKGMLTPEFKPTKLAIDYAKRPMMPDANELLKKFEKLLPRNPSFQTIAEGLSDTALIRAFYTILGEVGRRGDPDVPSKYKYWCEKCAAFEEALKNAEPNTLWEKHGPKQ